MSYATEDDLMFNTSTRLPVCLCIDTSGSMSSKDDDPNGKSRIARVKEGIEAFYQEIRNDEMTLYSAEICIVGFSDEPYIVRPFGTLQEDEKGKDVNIKSGGNGDIGLGVLKALELLNERKQMYKSNGVDYYQPWLIIMSDGHTTAKNKEDAKKAIEKAHAEVKKLEQDKKLTVVPVYIGGGLDDDEKASRDMGGFSDKYSVQEIKSTKFSDFFVWLGKSVSVATNDNDVPLDFTDLTDWSDF